MGKGRLEAFSDGVLAIIITIMVLELKVPNSAEIDALRAIDPSTVKLCIELRICRHLLEQPSSFVANLQKGNWFNIMGKSASIVLDNAFSVYHCLDGRKSLCCNTDGSLRLGSVDGCNRVLIITIRHHRLTRG